MHVLDPEPDSAIPTDRNAEPNFATIADVDAYVARFGQEHTMRRMMELRLHPHNRQVVEAWYWWQAEKDQQRLVVASEDTARAAVASADSARDSVRQAGRSALWAFCSVVVAAAALIVAIMSYLKTP